MIVDLFIIIFFIFCFLILYKRHQYNPAISAISLLVAVLSTRKLAFLLSVLLGKYGFAKEGYPIVIGYLLIIIIAWGLIYAILANFRTEYFDRHKIIFSIISSILFTASLGLMSCFALYYINSSTIENTKFCNICKMSPSDMELTEGSIVPADQGEVVDLKSSFKMDYQNPDLEDQVLILINSERSINQRAQLTSSERLKTVASSYATSILQSLRFSHIDGNNDSPAERASRSGISYTYFGENLAIAPDIYQAHEGLMKSASHKANILSGKFSKAGIAVYGLKNGLVLLVEEFSD